MTRGPHRLLALVAVAGCSAPAVLPDLGEAETHVHAGRWNEALAAYDRAIHSCTTLRDEQRARQTCAQAHLGRAELLDRMGRREEAAAAYEVTPDYIADDPVPSGTAVYRAGKIRLELGQDERGYELLWRAIAEFPDAPAADYALRTIMIDGRKRDPRQLYAVLGQLAGRLDDTEIGDNLLFSMADLARNELEEPAIARELYDRIANTWPKGALFDDSLWHGAALARAAGDAKGAVRRYRRLLSTREVAYFGGSYNSEWFDDSWLEMGVVLRDDLRDYDAALAAFRKIPADYPRSILLDDAMWERAVTRDRMGDARGACKTLATLRAKWPDSKYELERAPRMRERLACAL